VSLRWRIAAGLAAIAALVYALAAFGAYVATSRQLRAGVDDSLLTRSRDLSVAATPGDRERGRPRGGGPFSNERAGPCPPISAYQTFPIAQFVGRDGSVEICVEGPVIPVDNAERQVAQGNGGTRLRTVHLDGTRYRVLTVPWRSGAFQTGRDLAEVQSVLSKLQLRLAGLALAGVAAAGLLGWLLARRIVRPVERLRDAAEQIASTQDLSTPVPTEGTGEVGSLARSVTTMVRALATSREQQQRLITDASHELRTPLTSVRTNIELLRRAEDLPVDQRREVLDDLQLEVEELTNLVTEMVELATDRANTDETIEALQLGEVARAVVARASRRTGRMVDIDVRGDDTVVVRPQMLERAVSNLVDNALKYSPPPFPVQVTVEGRRLEVLDSGPGIPESDQPLVFDRFYRSVTTRTAPGSGLGLAIVKQIVERHGGQVWATNRPTGGARAGFELPATALGAQSAVDPSQDDVALGDPFPSRPPATPPLAPENPLSDAWSGRASSS
jgi:two-component system sensor histidine kinase MprB